MLLRLASVGFTLESV